MFHINWANDVLCVLLDQKEQTDEFAVMASKHVERWSEGGQDIKQNLPLLMQRPLPEKETHSTKRARSSETSQEGDKGAKKRKHAPIENNNKENQKQTVQEEKNTSEGEKGKKEHVQKER